MLSACQKGRIGEYLAAAVIETMGWNCIFSPANHFDLVAGAEDRFMRIQVKAASRSPKTNHYGECYYFSCATGSSRKIKINPAHVDIIAFVALDQRLVHFMPVKDVQKVTLRLRDEHFSKDIEAGSWAAATQAVTGKKWNVE